MDKFSKICTLDFRNGTWKVLTRKTFKKIFASIRALERESTRGRMKGHFSNKISRIGKYSGSVYFLPENFEIY